MIRSLDKGKVSAYYETVKTKIVYTVSRQAPRAAAELRERIIGTAGRRFFAAGFVRVTSDELSHELGISKRTLYSVFTSKEDILMAVIRRMAGETLAVIKSALDDPKMSFVDKIAVLGTVVGKSLSSMSPVFLDDVRRSAPEVWEYVEDFRQDKLMKNGRALMESGRREGFFRDDVDLDLVLDIFMDQIQRFVTPEAILSSGLPGQEVLRTVFSVFFGGVLTEKGRSGLGPKISFSRGAGEEEE